MKNPITPERERYHEILAHTASSLPDGALVYDIGRTHAYEYREWFPKQRYLSIDRTPKAEPDILLDVERLDELTTEKSLERADLVLCNGVLESATDPFELLRQIRSLLKFRKSVLFGIRLTAYPLSTNHDYFRFTEKGALAELNRLYNVRYYETVLRDGIPSYLYASCDH